MGHWAAVTLESRKSESAAILNRMHRQRQKLLLLVLSCTTVGLLVNTLRMRKGFDDSNSDILSPKPEIVKQVGRLDATAETQAVEAAAVESTPPLVAGGVAGPLQTLAPSGDGSMCKSFLELRNVDFRQPALQNALCSGIKAYEKTSDGFPMCKLNNPFDERVLGVVRAGSVIADLIDTNNSNVRIFVYAEKDYISEQIKRGHQWEAQLVSTTLNLALEVPNATFLDAGCNIGVYSLLAARLGLPVVSLDANIRNLLRLRLSLSAASLDAALVWNFIGSGDQLSYLNFPSDCNVGGATKFSRAVTDTIPVMPVRSDRLCGLISTSNVVIKLDVEGGEADFLSTSGCLFSQFNVAAVQMEFLARHMQGNDRATIVDFFTSRNYTIYNSVSFAALNTNSIDDDNVIWIHETFKHLVHLWSRGES